MAATRLIALHVNKGKTVAQSLTDRTDYAKNPEKTRKGELVTSYECDPMTVEEEFMLSRRQYLHAYDRQPKNDIIAYQIRQSFKPGEITPEEANRVGRELALRFTKGDYAFIVATHTDKAHIHNHIVFNSISVDGSKKFRNFFLSGRALQRLSDLICVENGLSVIEPAPYEKRDKRTTYPQRKSQRDILCDDIDEAFKQQPKTMKEFIGLMQADGYECKEGAHLAFRKAGTERFIRLDSLPEGYREEDIREALKSGSHVRNGGSDKRTGGSQDRSGKKPERSVNLIIDIQEKMQSKGPGYEKWAKTYNLKQMAKSLLYLRDHNINSMEELNQKVSEKTEKRDALLAGVKSSEDRLAEIATLKTHIINYSKTRGTYEDYRKSGYSKKFLEAHREEISLHKAAKQAFDELGVKKIPKVKELNVEYSQVLAEKKQMYDEYRQVRDETKELLTVQKNIESLYEADNPPKKSKQKRKEKDL